MAGKDKKDLRTTAETLVSRLTGKDKVKVPAVLASAVKEAVGTLTPFLGAGDKAAAASQTRDDALSRVGDADAVLDPSLDDIAKALVGAGLSPPKSPFLGFSKHSPSRMKALAYKEEVRAATDLLTAVAKKKPNAAVRAVMAKVQRNAAEVSRRLAAVSGPEAAYVKAMTARDAHLADVARAIARFKARAKGALVDEPETLAALFAPANPIQAPVKKRARKKAPGGGGGGGGGGATGGGGPTEGGAGAAQ